MNEFRKDGIAYIIKAELQINLFNCLSTLLFYFYTDGPFIQVLMTTFMVGNIVFIGPYVGPVLIGLIKNKWNFKRTNEEYHLYATIFLFVIHLTIATVLCCLTSNTKVLIILLVGTLVILAFLYLCGLLKSWMDNL